MPEIELHKPKYAIAVASLGHYRLRTMEYVKSKLGNSLKIYSGSPAYDDSIKVLTSIDMDLKDLQNIYLPGNILLQNIPLLTLLFSDRLILDLNPRVPHVWLLLSLRRMLGRQTLLWGHAFPRTGEFSRSAQLRGLLRKLSNGLITYTMTQAQQLAIIHKSKPIYVAPNALYFRREIGFEQNADRKDFLYVGRFDKAKKVDLLVSAFEIAAKRLPEQANLVLIGSGHEEEAIRTMVANSKVAEKIHMPGHISDHATLRDFYNQTIASVSPGYVGLSITQSFAFGVPMIIARDEKHSPEIEAAEEGRNCTFFNSDQVTSLADTMVQAYAMRDQWSQRGDEIAHSCAEKYSVEAMGDGLVAALTGCS